jgi:hypothetical protein
MRPEDYDDIDESTVEVHPPRRAGINLRIPLAEGDHEVLCDIGERDGKTSIDVAREAIHAFVLAQKQSRRLAS